MASSTPDSGAGAGAGDDLDQLLDSALDDFTNLDLAAAAAPQSGGDASSSAGRKPVQGLGMGLPDPRPPRRRAAKQRPSAPARGSYASEALEKLTRETREALRGLETATSTTAAGGEDGERLDSDAMVEEFMKQFEDMGGSQDMESIVETMMQQLLSKEILHEPMKEIVERYPRWLEENKDKISKEEYERYNNQLELMVTLNEVYENDPDNFSKVVDIMQKMQECGQPPSDIVQSIIPDLDLSNLGQLIVGVASPGWYFCRRHCSTCFLKKTVLSSRPHRSSFV